VPARARGPAVDPSGKGQTLSITYSERMNANAPEGLRLYAMGDIHGRLDLLDEMLEIIEQDDASREPAQTALIFLGDYVDRGSDSKGVVDRLTDGLLQSTATVILKGNHEDFLLSFLDEPGSGLNWLHNGGETTLMSYGVNASAIGDAMWLGHKGLTEAAALFRSLLPDSHLKFYRSLKLSYCAGDYFFAHAGVRPGVALDRQTEDDLIWIRGEFLNYPYDFGAVVVHGHTPARLPQDLHNRIGIDTLAFHTGKLTAVGLEGERRWFLST
jgi:serine/threonine protein phosphatase 1